MTADNRVEIILTADGTQAKAEVRGTADSLKVLDSHARTAAASSRQLSAEGAGIAAALGKTQGAVAGLSGSLVGLGVSLAASFGGAQAIAAWRESEQAAAKLEQTLISVGRVAPGLAEDLSALATTLATPGQGIIDDDALIAGQTALVRFGKIADEELPRATKLMADLAAAMGGDVAGAAEMLGKATIGNTKALRQLGIDLSAAEAKAMSTADIFAVVEGRVGGMNRALAETSSGQLIGVENAAGNLAEAFGRVLTEGIAPLARESTPLLGEMQGALDGVADALASGEAWAASTAYAEAFGEAIVGAGDDAVVSIGGVNVALEESRAFVEIYRDTLVGTVADGVLDWPTNLRAALTIMMGEMDQFDARVDAVMSGLEISAQEAWEGVRYGAVEMWDGIQIRGAEAVDAIIGYLASMVRESAAMISGMDWVPGLEEAAAGLNATAKGLQAYASFAKEANAAAGESAKVHEGNVAALKSEQAELEKASKSRIQAAKDAINTALEERDATLKRRDALVEEATEGARLRQQNSDIAKEQEQQWAAWQFGSKKTAAATDDLTKARKAAKDATAELKAEEKAHAELLELIWPGLQKNADAMWLLDTALSEGRIGYEEYYVGVEKVTGAFKAQQDAAKEAAGEAAQWEQANQQAALESQRALDQFASEASDYLVSMWDDPARAAEQFVVDLKKWFANLVLRPVIQAAIGGSLMGGSGLASAAGVSGVSGAVQGGGFDISSLLTQGLGAGIGSLAMSAGSAMVGLGATGFGSGLLASGGAIASQGLLAGGLSSLGAAGTALGAGNIGLAIGAAMPVLLPLIAVALPLISGLFESKTWTGSTFLSTADEANNPYYQNPQFDTTVAGRNRFATGGSEIGQLALGISRRGDLSNEDVVKFAEENQATIDALVNLDNAIAAQLDPTQLEAVRIAAEVNTGKVEDLDVEGVIEARYTAIFDAIGGEMDALYDSLVAGGAKGVDAAAMVANLTGAIDAYGNSLTDAQTAIAAAGVSTWQQAQQQTTALFGLVAGFDGSAAATQGLTSALSQQYQTEIALTALVEQTRSALNRSLEEQIRGYREAGLTERELYDRRMEELAGYRAALDEATDPAEIAALTGQIQQVTDDLVTLGRSVADDWASSFASALDNLAAGYADTLATIADVQTGLTATLADQIEGIRQGQMEEPALYEYLTDQAEALAATIGTLTDPEAIRQAGEQIAALTSQAYGLLDATQTAADPEGDGQSVADETMSFLDGVLELVNQQLTAAGTAAAEQYAADQTAINNEYGQAPDVITEAGGADILEGTQTDVNEQLDASLAMIKQAHDDLVEKLTTMFQPLIDAQQAAATTQQQAANTNLQAANTPVLVVVDIPGITFGELS